MKVITEKRLSTLLNHAIEKNEQDLVKAYIFLLERELKEIDTLTVSKLRPMCDAPKDGTEILIFDNVNGKLSNAAYVGGEFRKDDCTVLAGYMNEGWLPMPIYKP